MLNAKSLGVEKQIPLNPDMEYRKGTIQIESDSKFSAISNAFFTFNKYQAIMAGYLTMKSATINSGEKLLTLPMKPVKSIANPFISAQLKENVYQFKVELNGDLTSFSNINFIDGDYLWFNSTFPISNGGGYSVE